MLDDREGFQANGFPEAMPGLLGKHEEAKTSDDGDAGVRKQLRFGEEGHNRTTLGKRGSAFKERLQRGQRSDEKKQQLHMLQHSPLHKLHRVNSQSAEKQREGDKGHTQPRIRMSNTAKDLKHPLLAIAERDMTPLQKYRLGIEAGLLPNGRQHPAVKKGGGIPKIPHLDEQLAAEYAREAQEQEAAQKQALKAATIKANKELRAHSAERKSRKQSSGGKKSNASMQFSEQKGAEDGEEEQLSDVDGLFAQPNTYGVNQRSQRLNKRPRKQV